MSGIEKNQLGRAVAHLCRANGAGEELLVSEAKSA